MRKRTTAAMSIVAAMVLVAGIGTLILAANARATPPTSEKTALVVNGQAVPTREFAQFVAAERANTIGYFQDHYGAQVDSDFWSTRYGGTTPRAHLINAATTDAVRFSVQEQGAEKLKILVGFSYQNFLVGWAAENWRRAHALAIGQVIYGPQQYTETGYFQSISDSISSTLEKKLVATGSIEIGESIVKKYYEAHLANYPQSATGQTAPGPEPKPAAKPFATVEPEVRQSCVDLAFHSWVAHQLVIARVVRVSAILDSMVIS